MQAKKEKNPQKVYEIRMGWIQGLGSFISLIKLKGIFELLTPILQKIIILFHISMLSGNIQTGWLKSNFVPSLSIF